MAETTRVRDTSGRLSGAEEQQGLVGEPAAGHAQGREDTGERDRRGSLDVIIEDTDAIAIAPQQAEGGMIGKVLELDQYARKHIPGGGDELIDQLVVLGAAQAAPAQADVVRVRQQFRVVCTHVQDDGQTQLRVHARAGGIERKLTDRDAHAVGAEIAEAENALAWRADESAVY
jgi:hypothetical protein